MLAAKSALAQEAHNLVYNASFEAHAFCPQRIEAKGIMRSVEAWWQPSGGSSDYFNACSSRECGVPRNKLGYQAAHSGNAYCGIYCSQADYREYLQTQLREPLTKGRRYRVSFWVSLADKSPYAVGSIGALLTNERVGDSSQGVLMRCDYQEVASGVRQSINTYYQPQVVFTGDAPLDNVHEWVEISGEMTASGGEQYLTIGNFAPFNHSRVVTIGNENAVLQGAYYYVDDVEVVCVDSVPVAHVADTSHATPSGEVVELREVYFEVGRCELLPQSYHELTRLADMLLRHPAMRIEVSGHTDNQGTIEYNQTLSEARAKAVVDFLVGQGVEAKRLTWRGYGKTMPVASNDTPEGRSLNRRVEYKVL